MGCRPRPLQGWALCLPGPGLIPGMLLYFAKSPLSALAAEPFPIEPPVVATTVRKCTLWGPLTAYPVADFLLLKWCVPWIHFNSGWPALRCPPCSFCLLDDLPDELVDQAADQAQ